MDQPSLKQTAPDDGSSDSRYHVLTRYAHRLAASSPYQRVALKAKDGCVIAAAELGSALDQGVEYSLEIECRPADHLEHVGSGGLLLEGLAQLVEESGILDGDDGLFSEIAHELDLLVGERIHLFAVDRYRADDLVVLQHRDENDGPASAQFRGGDRIRIAVEVALFGHSVGDVNRMPRAEDTAKAAGRARLDRLAVLKLRKCWRRATQCDGMECAVRETVENAEMGITHARGVLQHRVEDRLQIAGRTGDDLEHLAGSGLLLECIGQLARACLHLLKKTGVLDSDHRLVGEGAEKRDLPFG